MPLNLDDLPGRALVQRGLEDRRAGRRSVEALLVTIAKPNLERLGLWSEAPGPPSEEPELDLYRALGEAGDPDPYSRYNALLRELDSFLHGAERRAQRGG